MFERNATRRTVLTTATGLAAASTGLAAFSGSAAAHWEDELDIDVEPGSDQGTTNPRSRGLTRVAVLTTESFDPIEEDVRYRFGTPEAVENGSGATPIRHHTEDVNGDGDDDLVLFFRAAEADFDADDEEALLHWDRDESREHGLSGRDVAPIANRS